MVTSTPDRSKPEVEAPPKIRKPGRPRAIPEELEPTVGALYRQGYGYRAIACILTKDFSTSADYSTVKRVLKRLGALSKRAKLTQPSSNTS